MQDRGSERASEDDEPATAAPGGGGGSGRSRWRDVVVPKTVAGAVLALFAASLGAAFSGAVLFAFYQSQLQDVRDDVERLTSGFDESLDEAIGEIEAERDDARSQIRAELEPLQELRASEETLQTLVEDTAESVWFVETRDPDGQPSVGSAFVVTADAQQSFLITSLHVVRASTASPSPQITLRKGDQETAATLWTWDEDRDLALLILERPNEPRLEWAPPEPPLGIGERVFAVAGIGGAGASITQGFVADVSSSGVQHDAAVDGSFEGGPLINSSGEVVGMATSAYAPLGFRSEDITYAPFIRAACERILACPDDGGEGEAPGSRR